MIAFKYSYHSPEGVVSYMEESENKGQILRERQVIRTENSSAQKIRFRKKFHRINTPVFFFFLTSRKPKLTGNTQDIDSLVRTSVIGCSSNAADIPQNTLCTQYFKYHESVILHVDGACLGVTAGKN